MGLDFTALESISLQTAQEDFREPFRGEAMNTPAEAEKPVTGELTAPQQHIHSHRLDKEKLERENMRKAYREYQQNIRRSGTLRAEILKGIQKGEDPVALLLKAMECISNMTGDATLYTQSQHDIKAVYGHGLEEVAPLQQDLPEATGSASHEAEHEAEKEKRGA